MILKIFDHEFWIKDDELPSYFYFMKDSEKLGYIWNNNLIHRENGPAIIWYNGAKDWCLNGEMHRLDGPAIIWSDGSEDWYLNGKYVDGETYKRIQSSSKEDLLVYMIQNKYKNFLSLIEYELNKD